MMGQNKSILLLVVSVMILLPVSFLLFTGKSDRVVIEDETIFIGDPASIMKKLNLNEKQMVQIGKINARFEQTMLDYRKNLKPLTNQMALLLKQEEVDLKEVGTILEKISAVKNQRRLEAIRHRIEIEKILSDEQKKTIVYRNFLGQ